MNRCVKNDAVYIFLSCIIALAMEFTETLQTQCTYVFDQLGPFAKEVHFQRALNINLLALGYTTDTEKCCSTVFRDLRGYLHTISSDRIDIYVHTLEGGYVLELKQADNLKPEYEQQARRYKRALQLAGHPILDAFVLLFPKSHGKTPQVHRV